jgi:UDP-N-acetylmuramoyl-L-alanyl-D-glutamate--2,6-diaminopimelate ligase
MAVNGSVPDRPVSQVTDDSREVRPDALFVAVRGAGLDGHRFVEAAVRRGAAAVLVEEDVEVPGGVVKVRVPSTRPMVGPLAHAFLGAPSERVRVVGITGTKGKTTVAWLTQHLLSASGLPCGLIGTVCHRVGEEQLPSVNTTPGAVALQGMLARMAESGQVACAMEVSSHALDQERAAGIRWACGVFTNLAPEHLDYHGDVERYLEAKLRLFRSLPEGARAVINRDDPSFSQVKEASRGLPLTYGIRETAELTAREPQMSLEGTSFRLESPEGNFDVRSALLGAHNLENLLAALGAVRALGAPLRRAVEAAPEFRGVPGRLERIECGQAFPVFVDYAHTDGSLRRVLEQLKGLSGRKILTVFGCGGDRDRTKRPRMGRAAAELSDRVIVTSDNPRSEDPAAIVGEILLGVDGAATPMEVILDRREAIRAAVESADEGWLVLIAGKGHEGAQIFADRSVPFDDRAAAREFLERRRVVGGCEV